MTRQEIKAKAKEQIKGKLWMLFAITALYVGITYLIGLIPPTWQDDAGNKATLGSYLVVFVTAPFVLSMAAIYLNVSRGIAPKIVDLFDGFRYTFKAVWLQILIGFFTVLWGFGAIIGLGVLGNALIMGSIELGIVGFVLLIAGAIPGIMKGISYSLSFFILANNPELTAREALNKSKQITNGRKMDLFVLQLSFLGLALLPMIVMIFGALLPGITPYEGWVMVVIGALLEIVGILALLFYLQPYIQTSIAHFYQDISEEDEPMIPADVVEAIGEQTEE